MCKHLSGRRLFDVHSSLGPRQYNPGVIISRFGSFTLHDLFPVDTGMEAFQPKENLCSLFAAIELFSHPLSPVGSVRNHSQPIRSIHCVLGHPFNHPLCP